MAKSKAEVNFMEHLKPLLPAGGDASELEAAAQTLAGLPPEDRDLLAAVQESPYRLTTLEQFREFPANTEYFVLEPNIRKRKRDIILLSYFLDMSDAEIAELLNVVRTTVFRHRKSALAKIKQYLEGKADDEYR